MAKHLTEEALDFARHHISDYYDTDFFPKAFEFAALWHCWEDVKKDALAHGPLQLSEATPVAMSWPKPRGAFRIVHQLEPIDAVLYTALTYLVCDDVEDARPAVEDSIACSFRIQADHSSFFAKGNGFETFRLQCEALSAQYPYVLSTDVADFYNQIYSHRVQNAIEHATNNPGLATEIERFVLLLNQKTSQGLPVGPAASIVLSEAIMIDVDQLIGNEGFKHARYVDDFRIFGNTARSLDQLLQKLSLYVYENHRLCLAADKTKIQASAQFLENDLNNQYQVEKLDILHEMKVLDPYGTEYVDDDEQEEDEEHGDPEAILLDALQRVHKHANLDLGTSRAIVRRAKGLGIPGIAIYLLENLNFFRPIVNDIVLYLRSFSDDEFSEHIKDTVSKMCADGSLDAEGVRIWFEWYFISRPLLLKEAAISAFVFGSNRLSTRANAARAQKNVAWVKEHKTKIPHLASWDRRALIFATSVLSGDERKHLLTPYLTNTNFSRTDKWTIRWVLDGCPEPDPHWDIPF